MPNEYDFNDIVEDTPEYDFSDVVEEPKKKIPNQTGKVTSNGVSFGSETAGEAVAKASKSGFSLAPTKLESSQGKTGNIPFEKITPDASRVEIIKPLLKYEKATPDEYAGSIVDIVNNAIQRGNAQGEEANLLTATNPDAPDSRGIAALANTERRKQYYPTSKEYADFSNAPDLTSSLSAFIKSPAKIFTELSLESLTALAAHGLPRIAAATGTGATLGSAIPGIGNVAGAGTGATVGLGLSSLNLEYSAKMLESMAQHGIDIADPESLRKGFEDEKLYKEIRETALAKGVPIALFDMASAGLAGRIISKPAQTIVKKALQTAAEVGTQVGLAGGGEAAGELAAGEKISPSNILAEMIGEGGGAHKIVTGALVQKVKTGNVTPEDVINVVAKGNSDEVSDQIDMSEHAGELTPEAADAIKQNLSYVADIDAKIPTEITNPETRSKSIQLIIDRDNIDQQIQDKTQELETIDEAFKPAKENEIKLLQQQRDEINKNIQTQTTENLSKQETGTGIPDGQAPEGEIKEVEPNAIENRIIEENNLTEHQNGDERRPTTEAGNRNSTVESGQKPQEITANPEAEKEGTTTNEQQNETKIGIGRKIQEPGEETIQPGSEESSGLSRLDRSQEVRNSEDESNGTSGQEKVINENKNGKEENQGERQNVLTSEAQTGEEPVGLSDEQKAKDNQEAEALGWTNAPAAINSIRKRTGEDYKTWAEIPKEVKEKVSKERKENLSPEDIEQVSEKLDKVISEDQNPGRRKKKKFILTVKGSPQTTEGVNEEVKRLEEYYTEVTNKESIAKADREIRKDISAAKDRIFSDEPLTAEKSALAIRLIKHYESRRDYSQAVDLIDAYDKQLREAGRFIQAASLWNKLAPETVTRIVKREIPNISKEALDNVYQRLSEIDKMPEGIEKDEATIEVLNYIADQSPPTLGEMFDAFRYQNMLSNPKSHLRNIHGNLFNVFVTRPASLIGEASKDFFSHINNPLERETKFSQIPKYYKDIFRVIPEALQGAIEVYKNGALSDKILDLGNAKNMIDAARKSRLPKSLTVVARSMEVQDRFFSVLIAEGEKVRLMREGIKQSDAQNRAQKLAEEYLYREKFNFKDSSQPHFIRALDALGQGINYVRRLPYLGKPLGWVVPFVTTPINMAKAQIRFTPLGFIGGDYNNRQIAAASIGSTLMAYGALMALQGLTTWKVPEDKEERELFYASGKKPYSIKIGDTWVPMFYFGPLALGFALPAATKYYQEDSKTALTDNQLEKLTKTVQGITEYFITQLPLEGIEGAYNLITGNDQTNIQKELAKLSGQIDPGSGMQRYITNALDPVYRKPTTYKESLQSVTPGKSEQLPAYYTPSGQEATREPVNMFLPYDIGINEPEYEALLQNRRQQLQREEIPKAAAKEFETSKESRDLSQQAKRQNKKEEEERKVKVEEKQERKDEYYEANEEEKKLRAIVKASSDPVPIILTKLKTIPRELRSEVFKKWKHLDIVSDQMYKDYEVDEDGTIKLKE